MRERDRQTGRVGVISSGDKYKVECSTAELSDIFYIEKASTV